ncbi:MAG: hypothetical protein ACJAWV_001259 [Flammeovirgaceae bacterium]|jgi:hypothetical protein
MKKNNFLLCLCAFLLLLGSCEQNNITPETEDSSAKISSIANSQIEGIFNNWSAQFPNADLQPISIEEPIKIRNQAALEAVIQAVSSPDAHYAYYDGENVSSMKVFTLSDAGAEATKSFANQKSRELVQVGQSYVTMNWEYKGKAFSTLFIYNEKGFVYEPISASIAVKEDLRTNTRTIKDWIQNFRLNWIWGGRRGEVKIKHTVNCNGSTINYADGEANGWMQLGGAEAEIITNGQIGSKSLTSWGYAWGTTGITISVSADLGASGSYQGVNYQGKVNASASGTFGSKGKGTGFNMLTCY